MLNVFINKNAITTMIKMKIKINIKTKIIKKDLFNLLYHQIELNTNN